MRCGSERENRLRCDRKLRVAGSCPRLRGPQLARSSSSHSGPRREGRLFVLTSEMSVGRETPPNDARCEGRYDRPVGGWALYEVATRDWCDPGDNTPYSICKISPTRGQIILIGAVVGAGLGALIGSTTGSNRSWTASPYIGVSSQLGLAARVCSRSVPVSGWLTVESLVPDMTGSR